MDENFGKTILVADDEESIREIVRLHLEKQGYNVITSENGKEAIDALEEFEISLAITDIKMPKVDGFGVLDYVNTHCSYVPVIVLTGYIDVETVVTSMKKGAIDYVSKPIKRDEFIDVVKNVLRKERSTLELKPFKISGLYLLDKGGMVIFHKDVALYPEFDSDMFGSMFTAIKIFIKDSLHSDENLRFIEHGSLKILVEEGKGFFLVVVGKGDVIGPVKKDIGRIVETINRRYGEAISHWSGNEEVFNEIGREFDSLLQIYRSGISSSSSRNYL